MASKCSAAMIEWVNALRREIPDEQSAAAKYSDMATKAVHFRVSGGPVPYGVLDLGNKILRKLASDEVSHALLLESMVEELTKECGKTRG